MLFSLYYCIVLSLVCMVSSLFYKILFHVCFEVARYETKVSRGIWGDSLTFRTNYKLGWLEKNLLKPHRKQMFLHEKKKSLKKFWKSENFVSSY